MTYGYKSGPVLFAAKPFDDSEVDPEGIVGGLNGVLAQDAAHQLPVDSVSKTATCVMGTGF